MIRLVRRCVVVCALLTSVPSIGGAQIRASELQTVAQTVDGTTITLTYSRPRLRGRTNVWGTRIVNWGEVWTPGANYATLLQTDRDITVSGVKVPKGKYSVWMVVSKDTTWTMLLDPKWKQFHEDHPKPNDTQIHVPVSAHNTATTVEDALTWSFPSVTARGGTMAMQWERMRVTMPFAVTPTLSELLPEAEAKPYLGTYALADTSGKEDGKLIVFYERGGLKARFEPEDKYMQTFALLRVGPEIFTAGLFMGAEVYAGGEIYEVLKPDFMLTFTRKGDDVTFEVRGAADELYFKGRRTSNP